MQTKARNLLVLVVLVAAITTIIFVSKSRTPQPAPQPPSATPTPLTIGYTPVTGNLALFVAENQGIFDRHGLDVTLQNFQNATLHTQALLGGKLDGSATIPLPTALLLHLEQPGRFRLLVANIYPREPGADGILVATSSPATSLADLRGKKIGVLPDASAIEFVKAMLEPSTGAGNFEIVQIPVPNQVDALAAGTVDAIWALEPTLTVATQKHVARILEEGSMSRHVAEPMVTAAFTLSSAFIAEHPRAADEYKSALIEAAHWIEKEPEAAKRILPSYTNLPPELATHVRLVKYADIRDVESALSSLSQWLRARNLLKADPPLQSLLY